MHREDHSRGQHQLWVCFAGVTGRRVDEYRIPRVGHGPRPSGEAGDVYGEADHAIEMDRLLKTSQYAASPLFELYFASATTSMVDQFKSQMLQSRVSMLRR